LFTLGQFHERQGDQMLLNDPDEKHAVWGRASGGHFDQQWNGTVHPSFSGWIGAIQVGADAFNRKHDSGALDRIGPFAGYSRASGDGAGSIEGLKYKVAGQMVMEAATVGAYWTHISSSGWYVDGVAMGSWFTATPRSIRGVNTHVDGS